MNKPIAYEIWLLQDSGDKECLLATFENRKNAIRFFGTLEDYDYEPCYDRAVLEEVEYEPDGSGTCVGIVMEATFLI